MGIPRSGRSAGVSGSSCGVGSGMMTISGSGGVSGAGVMGSGTATGSGAAAGTVEEGLTEGALGAEVRGD